MENVILYGTGSALIVDFEEVCLRNDVFIEAVVNNIENGESYAINQDKEIWPSNLSKENKLIPFLCTLFTPANRRLAVKEALSIGLKPYPLLCDKSSDLPIHFKHGEGCFINKRVIIGSMSSIGSYVTINRGANLGHHLRLDDFVSIGPGVTAGGNVTVKNGSLIGTGAVVLPSITIGKNAIVGAGAVVTKDVPDNCVVVGNPAKIIKQR